MGILNRSAVILRPKKPFLDWRNSIEVRDGRKGDYTLSALREDLKVYLVPGFRDPKYVEARVFEEFDLYFIDQLQACITMENEWPKNRTVEMFKKWFDIEIIVFVDDAVIDQDIIEEE